MGFNTIDKCKRVMWRVREKTNSGHECKFDDLQDAIWHEIGMDDRTVKRYIERLTKLKWIKRSGRYTWHVLVDVGGGI